MKAGDTVRYVGDMSPELTGKTGTVLSLPPGRKDEAYVEFSGRHGNRFVYLANLEVLTPVLVTTPPKQHGPLPEDSAARKEYPLYRGLFAYFPSALAAIAKHSKEGNDKHNPGQDIHHARGKSSDHRDALLRHVMEDDLVGAAWRALALLQEDLEAKGAPVAPGARFPDGAK